MSEPAKNFDGLHVFNGLIVNETGDFDQIREWEGDPTLSHTTPIPHSPCGYYPGRSWKAIVGLSTAVAQHHRYHPTLIREIRLPWVV